MSTLADSDQVVKVINRLKRLERTTSRRWGTMSPDEMICHLADSYQVAMGERTAGSLSSWFNRTVVRFIALHTPMKWPKGVPTMPEVNPKKAGTKPEVFLADKDRLIGLIRRFSSGNSGYGQHPLFGELSREEWLIWGFRHADHHLRQFGL